MDEIKTTEPPTPTEVIRPTDMEIFGVIVAALADHYLVPVSTVIGWLDDMDIDSVARTFRSD